MSIPDCATIALILVLAMGPTSSVREQVFQSDNTAEPPSKPSKGVLTGSGWLCEDISLLKKPTDPAEVQQYLTSLELYSDYTNLKQALVNAPKSRLKSWKGSAISREIFSGNHANVFGAKNVEVFLAKKKNSFIKASFMLCFAESHAQFPTDTLTRYSDGFSMGVGCVDYNYKRKSMPSGVAAQTYNDQIVRAEPDTLPVEVLKLLSAKDAMDLHRRFAKEVNGKYAKYGKQVTPSLTTVLKGRQEKYGRYDWAALITFKYQQDFKAHGLGLYYHQFHSMCPCGPYGSPCPLTNRWFEYADLDIVNVTYIPTFETDSRYPISKIWEFLQCEAPKEVPQQIVLQVKQEKMLSGNCSDVDKAVPREKTENACKCPKNYKVFCNGKEVAGRKFRLDEIREQPECKSSDMYCATKECKHNMYMTE